MSEDTSIEALNASIKFTSKIIGAKERCEQELAAAIESANISVLLEVFRMGVDVGIEIGKSQKD
jgi:hypothetical protein